MYKNIKTRTQIVCSYVRVVPYDTFWILQILITMYTVLFLSDAANVEDSDLADGNDMVDKLKKLADSEGAKIVVVSAQVEAELSELDPSDRLEFLESLGVQSMENCGLRALIGEAYNLLQLQTYYTSGPEESRAWTIKKGWTAPQGMCCGLAKRDLEIN